MKCGGVNAWKQTPTEEVVCGIPWGLVTLGSSGFELSAQRKALKPRREGVNNQ